MIKRFFALLSVSFHLCSEEPSFSEPFVEQSCEPANDIFLSAVPLDSTLPGVGAFSESIASQPISTFSDERFANAPIEIKKMKSPGVAVGLSGLIPGLGHYYLGDYRTASELLGSTILGGVCAFATKNDPALFTTSVITMNSVGMYGIYAAYRDTKLHNGNAMPTMPKENFKDLSAAPFQWSVMKKPEVWGGVLGALAVGTAVAYLSHPASMKINTGYIEPLKALPVAIGEESLFRGFLQTACSEKMSPWQAIALSSLVFGAAHIPNAMVLEKGERSRYYAVSVPYITSLGAYLGWLSYKNHSLKESVALHAWYDFTLMCVGTIATQAAIGGETHLFYNFEF